MNPPEHRIPRSPGTRWVIGALLLVPALVLLFLRSRLVAQLAPVVGTAQRATSLLDLLMWGLIAAASFTAPQAKRVARILLLAVVVVYLVSAIRSFL